jgi:hypothetical protein
MGPSYATQLSRVTAIGAKRSRALDKASKGGPGMWDQTTAWIMAEAASRELGEMVDVYSPPSSSSRPWAIVLGVKDDRAT